MGLSWKQFTVCIHIHIITYTHIHVYTYIYIYIYIYTYIHTYIHTYTHMLTLRADCGRPSRGPPGPLEDGLLAADDVPVALGDFKDTALHILRIGYLVPRMFVCVRFSCLAISSNRGMSKQYPLAVFLESPRL